MRNFILLIVFVFSFNLFGYSQYSKSDSLQIALGKASRDSSRFKVYFLLGLENQEKNPDSALYYLEKGIDIGAKHKNNTYWENLLSGAYRELANTYNIKGKPVDANSYFSLAIELNRKLSDQEQLASNLNNLGANYYILGDYERSIDLMFETLSVSKKMGDKKTEAGVLRRIGVLYSMVNDIERAIEYTMMGLHGYEQIGDAHGMSTCYSNLGTFHYERSQLNGKKDEKVQLDSSLFYHRKSFDINKRLELKSELARNYTNISNVYSLQGKVDESYDYNQRALELYKEIGDKHRMVIGYGNMAGANITFADSIHGNKVKKRMYLDSALRYEKKAFALAKELNMTYEVSATVEYMKNIYKRLGEYEKALEYAELSAQYQDSLINEEKTRAIEELSMKYETKEKEQQLEIQKAQIQNEKILRYMLIIGLLAFGAVSYYVFRNYKRKRKDNQLLSKQKKEIALQAEQLGKTNKKLRELDEFKQGMTNMIVHDLKNPLNTIINLSDSDSVRYAANQMHNLVLNILDTSKYENARMEIESADFSIHRVLQRSIDQIQFVSEGKNIVIANGIDKTVGVYGDSEIVKRIFVNLFLNALKFTPVNGQIKLRSHKEMEKNQLVVSVQDFGPGIPKEYHQKVFERFSQIEPKSLGNMHSYGLGLTFCKMAVKAHGGEIWIDKEYSQGTSISFSLPLSSVPVGQTETNMKFPKKITLSEQEVFISHKYLLNLKELEISEITAFRQLFKEMEREDLINKEWLQELKNAVHYGNKKQFTELIDMLD